MGDENCCCNNDSKQSVCNYRLMGTVESCLFNVLVPPSFDQRKKAETNDLLSYLSD